MNAKILEQKKVIVNDIYKTLDSSNCAVVVSYAGITVKKLNELRTALKKVGANMKVQKNTLVRRAVEEEGLKSLESLLTGQNAIVTSAESTSALPVLQNFAKKNKSFEIKGAIIEKQFCDAAKIDALANVGGKEGALSMLLSVLEAPIRQFAVACKAVGEQKQ